MNPSTVFFLGMIFGAGLLFILLAALGEVEWETTYTVVKSDSEDKQ